MVDRLKRVGRTSHGRLKSSALVVLVLLSVVASTGVAFLNTGTVHAAPAGVYVDPGLEAKIKAFALGNALTTCIKIEGGNQHVSLSALIAGNWFVGGADIAVTHLVQGDTGRRNCTDSGFVIDALNAQGYATNDMVSIICAMGAKDLSGSSGGCLTGTDFQLPTDMTKVQNAIQAQRKIFFKGDSVSNLTAPETYLLAAESMRLGCLANPIALNDNTASATDKAIANSPNGWTMQVVTVDTTGKPVQIDTIYQAKNDRGRKITTYSNSGFNNVEDTCLQLRDRANANAAAYLAYLKTLPAGSLVPSGGGAAGSGPTCDSTNGAGGLPGSTDFILCPTTASVIDSTNSLAKLISGFLTVSPLATSSVIYELWKSFRDLANILLVILFFVIIFSQATSIGISNYGIKKILPKLVLVAIGANLSFFLVAFVIDSFNILGGGLIALTDTVLHNANITTGASGADLWAGVGLGVLTLALAAHLYHSELLRIIGPIIGIGFLAVLLFFIILALRQMIIILLVIVAAPAIVLSLLPGTESYFKKWWGLLLKMLIMYPIVVLILIASSVAGNILGQV